MNLKYTALLLLVAAPLAAAETTAPDWTSEASVKRAAVAGNPTLLRLDAEIQAARERRLPAGAQPNPMVMAGVQDKQVNLTDDEMMTMYMVGVTQTFTRRSKLTTRQAAIDADVNALLRQQESLRAEIERDVQFALYDVASADASIAATEQVRQIVTAIVEAARVRYEVGNAAQAEVIRAQLERSNLDHQLLALRGARRSAVARLLPLLGLPPGTAVPRITLPPLDSTGPLTLPAAIPATHPALTAVEAEIARRAAEARLAGLLLKPDVTLQASYGYRAMQVDMFSVTASVEIPWKKKQLVEPRVREALALRDAARHRMAGIERTLMQALATAVSAHEETVEQLRFHEEVLVPQSKLAIDSTLADYQTGRTSFDSILGAESTYLRLQLDAINFLTRHAKATADFAAIMRGARAGASNGAAPTQNAAPAAGQTDASMNTM
jgi:cobalt-zinc-cadmium efflux system outer membrane protein